MDFGSLDQAGFLRLLKRLQGKGGYSEDDDSNRVKELNAIAKVAELASEAIELVGRNQFVSAAVEALLSYEALYGLPSDYNFTDAQRQARLKAFWAALPKMIEARLDAAFDAYLGTTTGSTIRMTSSDAWNNHAAPSAAGLHVQRREPSADAAERRTLDPILARGLPARALGGKLSIGDATFGSGSIERKSINQVQSFAPGTQTKSMAAPYPYYPGSVLDAATWKEIQAMLMWKGKSATFDQTALGRTIIVRGSIPAGNTAVLDGPTFGGGTAINWENRIVQAWGVFSSTDVRTGDLTLRPSSEHGYTMPFKTGTGAGFANDLYNISANATLQCTFALSGSGDLVITNYSAGTRYFVLMIRCSPTYTPASSVDTQPWVNTVDITNANLTQIARSAEIRDADGGGATWTKTATFSGDRGAIRRVLYTGPLAVGPVDAFLNRDQQPRRVILDSSEDWRNRYVLIVPTDSASATEFPLIQYDGATNLNESARLFHTGPGAAVGSATALGYQQPNRMNGTASIWIFADSTTGDLVAEMKSTASVANFACCLFMAIGSEKTDGSGVATPVPLHATQIHALDLNQIQNNGCFAQGFQGGVPRSYVGASVKRTIPTCPPLGLIAQGSMPRRPLSWLVRERVGDYDEDSDGYYESRQKLFGQRKRFFSEVIAPGGTVALDDFNLMDDAIDQMDFRDRFVHFEGKQSALDITVGAGVQTTDGAASRIGFVMYMGPFNNQTAVSGSLTFTFEMSRKGTSRGLHSRFTVTNGSGASIYLNLAIEASGYLGLTDRRLYGASP